MKSIRLCGRQDNLFASIEQKKKKSPALRDKAVLETSTAHDGSFFFYFLITYARAAYIYKRWRAGLFCQLQHRFATVDSAILTVYDMTLFI